jgi:hypothetical protein
MATQTKSRTRSRANTRNTRNTRANGPTEANTRSNEAVFEDAADRVRDLNERVIEATRNAGHTYLDAYEKTLRGIASYEEKVAEASQVEWLSALLTAQADFTREIAKASTASARELLK